MGSMPHRAPVRRHEGVDEDAGYSHGAVYQIADSDEVTGRGDRETISGEGSGLLLLAYLANESASVVEEPLDVDCPRNRLSDREAADGALVPNERLVDRERDDDGCCCPGLACHHECQADAESKGCSEPPHVSSPLTEPLSAR